MRKILKAEFLALYEKGALIDFLVTPIAILAVEILDDGTRGEGVWVELP